MPCTPAAHRRKNIVEKEGWLREYWYFPSTILIIVICTKKSMQKLFNITNQKTFVFKQSAQSVENVDKIILLRCYNTQTIAPKNDSMQKEPAESLCFCCRYFKPISTMDACGRSDRGKSHGFFTQPSAQRRKSIFLPCASRRSCAP